MTIFVGDRGWLIQGEKRINREIMEIGEERREEDKKIKKIWKGEKGVKRKNAAVLHSNLFLFFHETTEWRGRAGNWGKEEKDGMGDVTPTGGRVSHGVGGC